MRPFGFIVVFAMIFIIIQKRNFEKIYVEFLAMTICIETFINQGYFIRIQNIELEYSELLIAVLSVLSVTHLFRAKSKNTTVTSGILLISVILFSNILLIISPYKEPIVSYGMGWNSFFSGSMVLPSFTFQTVKMTLRVVLFIVIAVSCDSILDEKNINRIIKLFMQFGIFVIGFASIEFITKNIIKSNALQNIYRSFFGTASSTVELMLERSGTFSLQGFMREPAHFALSLFFLGLVLILSSKQRKSIVMYLIAICLFLFASRSFSAILYIVMLLGIYSVIYRKKLVYALTLVICVPLATTTGYFAYYIERLSNVFNFTRNFTANRNLSEHVRFTSIVENFKIFLHRPFWGIGVGTTYAHGFLPTFLASVGLIGFSFWLFFIFKGIAKMKITRKSFFLVTVLLLSWIVSGSIAISYSMSLLLIGTILRFNNEILENYSEVTDGY